jgi:hypothetical protein
MPDLFAKSDPIVSAIYREVKAAARTCGPYLEEQKETRIHLVRNRTAFAGVRAQKASLRLTLKSSRGIASERIAKQERVSANRWYFDVKLHSPDDVDRELKAWMKAAYELAGEKAPASRG